MKYVALLRGINVGGKHKLPMRELAAIFEDAGAAEVRTYIQSGNVLFETTPAGARALPARIVSAVADAYGFDVPVVTRSAREWGAVVRGNPFLKPGVDPTRLAVAFLEKRPTAAAARSLDPDRSPPDRFALTGRDLYLDLPNGIARTKLTNAYIDRTLGTTSTVRNWRTVLKLAEMLAAD